MKSLAPACSLILSCIISKYFLDFDVSASFFLGGIITLTSTWIIMLKEREVELLAATAIIDGHLIESNKAGR